MKVQRFRRTFYVVLNFRHEQTGKPVQTVEALAEILGPLYAILQLGTMEHQSSPPPWIAVRLFGMADEMVVYSKLVELGYTLTGRNEVTTAATRTRLRIPQS